MNIFESIYEEWDSANIAAKRRRDMHESVAIKAKKRLGQQYEDAVWTAPGESPRTFNGKPLSAIKSPSGSPVVCKFYTNGNPNTEYILCASGECRRIKGDQGGNDMGLHPWRDLMYFGSEDAVTEISNKVQDANIAIPGWKPSIKQAKSLMPLLGRGYTLVYTHDGRNWYTHEGTPVSKESLAATKLVWKLEKKPKIGLYTLDMGLKRMPEPGQRPLIASVHHGHMVKWIEK